MNTGTLNRYMAANSRIAKTANNSQSASVRYSSGEFWAGGNVHPPVNAISGKSNSIVNDHSRK